MSRPRQEGLVLCFFQAEDGIRDLTVTGVQTCALPISYIERNVGACRTRRHCARYMRARRRPAAAREIGRASCRERVEISEVGVSLKKKKLLSVADAARQLRD